MGNTFLIVFLGGNITKYPRYKCYQPPNPVNFQYWGTDIDFRIVLHWWDHGRNCKWNQIVQQIEGKKYYQDYWK